MKNKVSYKGIRRE